MVDDKVEIAGSPPPPCFAFFFFNEDLADLNHIAATQPPD